MKTTCPHCDQHIEIDDDSAEFLKGVESFECPTCTGAVPVPKASDPAPEKSTARVSTPNENAPNPLMAVFGRMNRTMRILGVLALLVVGGLAIFLSTRKSGDTYHITRKIRDEIIQNEFFTRLIASGATTREELEKVQAFVPYGAGYLGLSEAGWSWNEAGLLARRVSADVADVALLPHDSRKAFGTLLAGQFPAALGEAAWVRDNGEPWLIDSPDLLRTTALDRPRRVFLSWPKSGDWKNHGWSWTIAAQFDEVTPFSDWGLAAVRVGRQWGIIDESGKFVQAAQFDLVGKFSEKGCARVSVGDNRGLVNRKGELVAKPEWEDVQDQISGFTPVKKEGKWGYLDASGVFAEWEDVQDHINGFTPVKKEGKWGYLDAGGVLVIACEWDDAWRFSPLGYAVVTRDFKRGIIDRSGKVIVDPEWDGATNFSKEGLGMVRRGDGWALIDATGKRLTEPTLKTRWRDRRWDLGILATEDGVVGMDGKAVIGERAVRLMALTDAEERFPEGLARVDTKGGSGFIDTFGEWVIPPSGPVCRVFSEGFAASREGGKWGFIDRTGKPVILAEWDEVTDFSDGAAGVKRGERWGLIGRDGKLISDPVWDEVRAFREGIAAVRREEKWGFVSRAGKMIAQPTWKTVGDFSEGFASVEVDATAARLETVPDERNRYYNRRGPETDWKWTSRPGYRFWTFIDVTGRPAFEDRVWFESVFSKSFPPAFIRGMATLKSGDEHLGIDTQGRALPYSNRYSSPSLTSTQLARKGVVLQRRNNMSQCQYLNRNGDIRDVYSLVDRDKSVVIPEVNGSADLLGDFIPYAVPPKYGIIDLTGKVIVPPTWDEARVLSPDWVWFRVGDKCGLADKTGSIHIAPTWDELEILAVDSGSLGEDKQSVLVGDRGEAILSPWIRVRDGEKTSILQMSGKPAIPDTMPDAEYVDFYDTSHIVIKQPDPQGGFLLSLYEPATGKKQTFPAVAKMRWNWNTASLGFVWMQDKISLRWHLRGRNGEHYNHSQPEPEKPEGWGFIEGRGRLHQEVGWFHIGTDGKPISAERWEEAHDFSEGRAAVKRAGVWGYIGLDGAMVTEMVYEEAHDFSRGLAAVKVGGRWGFIDPAGAMVIAAVWDEVTPPNYDQTPGFYRWFGEPGTGDPPGEAPFLDVAQVKVNGVAALIGRDGGLIVDPRLPKVPQEGAAYLNGEEQLIVMRREDGTELVKREWKSNPNRGGNNSLSIELSPARQFRADEVETEKWVLLDETAKVLTAGNWIRPKVNRTSDPFSQGLIHARDQNEKYGLIRKDGTTVMEPRFDSINWVAPRIAAVWSRDEGGLITAEGQWLFQDNGEARIARFVRPTDAQFRHGLAVIEDAPKWGYARLNRTAPTPKAP